MNKKQIEIMENLAKYGLYHKVADVNIETAKKIAELSGLTGVTFSNYSDTNGVSVYFRCNESNKIVRVSDHGISNFARMEETICLSFDARLLPRPNRPKFKSFEEQNKRTVYLELKHS